MALVPSGHFRVMETQQFKTAQSPDPSVLPAAEQPREQVEQQELGGEQNSPPSPAPSVPSAQGQQPANAPEAGEAMVAPQGEQPPQNGDASLGESASSLKAYIYKILEQQGVQRRQLENIDKHLYSQETDLDDHTVKGHYMIPTFTPKGEIDERAAQHVAKEIGNKFGLKQNMKLEGKNWRVNFQSRPQPQLQQGGSSFDEFHSEGGQRKAASTIGEMIKARKDDLYNTMRQITQKRGS